jgi:hypothetical protein
LIERVIDQTQRRVFAGMSVPSSEKLVSLFEPHADIIVKSRRDVKYGHKLNIATGKSGSGATGRSLGSDTLIGCVCHLSVETFGCCSCVCVFY